MISLSISKSTGEIDMPEHAHDLVYSAALWKKSALSICREPPRFPSLRKTGEHRGVSN
jgi:hypothetical protein